MDQSSPEPSKVFTVPEAEAALPEVKALVEQLQGLQRSILKTNTELDDTVAKISGGNGYPIRALKDEVQRLTKHQLQLIEAFQSSLSQLESLGVVLKDLSAGLVDFYARRDGTLVFLCWKLGEDRIGFWHGVEEGYGGRRPLDESSR